MMERQGAMPPRAACCLTAVAAVGSARSSQPKAHRVGHPRKLALDSFPPGYQDRVLHRTRPWPAN
jgi:hypothetical protein